ncbi:MAG: DUF202 domain-containing protein [Desulfobacterales bacterium]
MFNRPNPNEILEGIKRSPTNMLALGRTVMASERTLLGFIRTSVGLMASGVGLVKFFDNPILMIFGWCLIFASAVFIVWGIRRYRYINKLLRRAYEELKLSLKDEN